MKILTNKSIWFLLSAILLTFISASAQAQTYEAWTEKKISEIRAEVLAINKGAAKYKKTTKSVEGISLEGTEATFFHSGKTLKKINAQIYGETYKAAGEFYYANGELIFAFVKRERYDTRIGLDTPPKVASTEEQRFYFAADGTLIRLLVGQKELKFGDENYSRLKAEIANLSSKLKND